MLIYGLIAHKSRETPAKVGPSLGPKSTKETLSCRADKFEGLKTEAGGLPTLAQGTRTQNYTGSGELGGDFAAYRNPLFETSTNRLINKKMAAMRSFKFKLARNACLKVGNVVCEFFSRRRVKN